MEKILTAFYGKKDTKKYMKRIKKTTKKFKGGKWLHRIKTGSSRLCIIRRFDLAAPGTTVLSCWNKNKMFLAGNAFFLSDSENPELEKFLCLWLNSTFVLTKMIEHMTITRGTWMSFEKSSYMNLPIPDTSLFDKDVWERINKVFREVSNQDWPSLIKQLKEGGGGRSTIDDFVLELLGVNDESKRREIAEKTRRGVYDAISFLQNTMG